VAAAKAGLQWLSQNGRDDPQLMRVLRGAAKIQPARLAYSEAVVKQLIEEAKQSGNAKAGFAVVRNPDLSCLGCHRIGNEGGPTDGPALGPDLSAIGRAMTPEMIVESLLWPKRQVKEGFLLTQVTMKDGRQAQGYKTAENQAELKLRCVDGSETILRKAEIQERSDVGTLMPDGLTDALSAQERRDLVRYLIDLGKTF
jgi:putative heme-binding domain-containing protein